MSRLVLFLLSLCLLHCPCEARSGICLVMQVENDASIIEECLHSVQEVIDCVCICNVGSNDATLPLLDTFMNERKVPGRLVHYQGKDLLQAQTLCVAAAKETLQVLGYSLESSYLLFFDPEMRLDVSPTFYKESLQEDAYCIVEQSSDLKCACLKMHLLRASLPFEAFSDRRASALPNCSSCKIAIPFVSQEKLQKKAAYLQSAAMPPPVLLELALIQSALGKNQEALLHLQSCLRVMQEREEIWFCKWMMGKCYEKMEEWDKALYWFLEAFQTDPNRAESLHSIAAHYRFKGMNDLACLFAKHGSQIPLYEDPFLSPWPPLAHYHFDEDLSIAAYYTRFKSDGQKANLQLLLRKAVPAQVRDQAYRNALFYIQPLANAHYKPIAIDLPLIEPGFDERYHPMNPSIQKTKTGYVVICRSVNYTQKGARSFHTIDSSGVFRTRNFLVHYDRDLNVVAQQEIVEDLPRQRIRSFNLEGLDDCRLFPFQNSSWFTCTTSDTNPAGNFQISLCRLGSKPREGTVFVDKLIPLLGPDPHRCEKNWLPFILEGSLHVIYSYDPFLIYRVDPDKGSCDKIMDINPPLDFSRFRGSAAPIPWKGGYLLLVHEVVFHFNYERTYIHRFLFLDSQLQMQQLSDPFYFQHQGVEFCCGMQVDHSKEHLILTLGEEDRDAYFCQVPVATVQSLLKPISTLVQP